VLCLLWILKHLRVCADRIGKTKRRDKVHVIRRGVPASKALIIRSETNWRTRPVERALDGVQEGEANFKASPKARSERAEEKDRKNKALFLGGMQSQGGHANRKKGARGSPPTRIVS